MGRIPQFQLDLIEPKKLVQSYIENGFVLVKDVLSIDEREQIKGDLARINKGVYSSNAVFRPGGAIEPVDWEDNDQRLLGRYMYIGEPHVYSSIVRQYITHPGICRVLDLIVGAYVPFWDDGYKCVQTMFVTKKPGGNGSPWHQDEHPIPTRDRSLTGVWIPLSDVTVDNGCLWIVPDSHKSGVIYERYKHDLPDVDSMPIARGFDDASAIPIEMQADSVLFFSGYLLHSSKKNVSSTYRPALTMHYCSSSTLLTWKGERNYRGVIQIRGQDPYAAEGYVTPVPWVKVE